MNIYVHVEDKTIELAIITSNGIGIAITIIKVGTEPIFELFLFFSTKESNNLRCKYTEHIPKKPYMRTLIGEQ